MKRLEGKTALVTGAGRGIGRAIAVAFAEEGASTVLAARSVDQIEGLAEEIRGTGRDSHAVPTDVTSEASAINLVEEALSRYGKIDVLVNSAGIYKMAPFWDYSLDDWKQVIDVNLHGTFIVTKEVTKHMRERSSGRVINIASTAGKWGSMYSSAYNASKHAVLGLTKCLALETAPIGIRVNAICPAFVDSPMIDEQLSNLASIIGTDVEGARSALLSRIPIGRFIRIEEIPPLALYLASDDSDAMTGAALTMSGGMVLI